MRRRATGLAALLCCAAAALAVQSGAPAARSHGVRIIGFVYRSHTGALRRAYLALPQSYPARGGAPLPLVISPHGRGIDARQNLKLWGSLPAVGGFAVVSPEGQGRVLGADSWGAAGQIRDLARMPKIVRLAFPWLRIDGHRIFAVGGSMGGQEVLLLVARYSDMLAGAAAFDSVSDLGLQYRNLMLLHCRRRGCINRFGLPFGVHLRHLMRKEVGGSPAGARRGYAGRSPLHYAEQIAASGVPLELWWSSADLVVPDQTAEQSGALLRRIELLNPDAPVEAYVGHWIHSHEQRSTTQLPYALAQLGLLPPEEYPRRVHLHFVHGPHPLPFAVQARIDAAKGLHRAPVRHSLVGTAPAADAAHRVSARHAP